jgi:hypothetical protein
VEFLCELNGLGFAHVNNFGIFAGLCRILHHDHTQPIRQVVMVAEKSNSHCIGNNDLSVPPAAPD